MNDRFVSCNRMFLCLCLLLGMIADCGQTHRWQGRTAERGGRAGRVQSHCSQTTRTNRHWYDRTTACSLPVDELLVEIPFNMGTNHHTQNLLEGIKKHPTGERNTGSLFVAGSQERAAYVGWGGVFSSILQSVPSIDHYEQVTQRGQEL